MNEQFQALRFKLFGIAYRMLGSASDAEDVLQDAYLRLLATDSDNIRLFDSYACTVVTRLCLDRLKSAKQRREVYPGIWLPEPVATESLELEVDPTERVAKLESLSLAFLLILETLSVEERAVFLLREVFDYDYAEIAQVLEKSEAACRQLLSRAKKAVTAQRPRFHTSAEEHKRIFAAFVEAANEGNMAQLAELLTTDVTALADGGGKATAIVHAVKGRKAVLKLLQGLARSGIRSGNWVEQVSLNGREGWLVHDKEGIVTTAMLFEIGDGAIQRIFFVRNPDKLAGFSKSGAGPDSL